MNGRGTRIARLLIGLIGVVVAVTLGWFLFVFLPGTLADLLGVLLVLASAVGGGRAALRLASSIFPRYNVAEVAVEGPITRDGGSRLPSRPGGASADDITEQIERADAEGNVDALLLKLNTPGGEVVPSDDIRGAAAAFDGPTIAYATDICASGGYWIASGCDALWAREASVVGSIGVRWGFVNATELAEKLGVSYEGFSQGEYKEAGFPLKDLTDEEREYFEERAGEFYDIFVDRVSEARGLDPEEVKQTEARIYLGEEAVGLGLVDELGGREDIETALEAELGKPIQVEEFEPERPLVMRLGLGARRFAFALGAGMASGVVGEQDRPFELR